MKRKVSGITIALIQHMLKASKSGHVDEGPYEMERVGDDTWWTVTNKAGTPVAQISNAQAQDVEDQARQQDLVIHGMHIRKVLPDGSSVLVAPADAVVPYSPDTEVYTRRKISAEEHCRWFCAWKGGGPCLASDCPRKKL